MWRILLGLTSLLLQFWETDPCIDQVWSLQACLRVKKLWLMTVFSVYPFRTEVGITKQSTMAFCNFIPTIRKETSCFFRFSFWVSSAPAPSHQDRWWLGGGQLIFFGPQQLRAWSSVHPSPPAMVPMLRCWQMDKLWPGAIPGLVVKLGFWTPISAQWMELWVEQYDNMNMIWTDGPYWYGTNYRILKDRDRPSNQDLGPFRQFR